MAFSSEALLLIKVLRQKKVMTIDEWSHCFIGDNCEREWVRIVMETLALTRNWKHVIKYDKNMIFMWNFHEFLHTMHKYVLSSVVKISTMFAMQYFEYYAIILRGPFFVDTLYR